MKYKIIEKDTFQVVGVKRECSCDPACNTENAGLPSIGEFWGEVHQNDTVNQLIQLNNGQIKGLLGITDNYNEEKNTIDYWIASEHSGDVPDGLSSFEIPASKWVVFDVQGPAPTAMINTWKQIYSEWFPSNSYEPADTAAIEAYIDSDLYSPNSTNEIWVAIK
ncbi:hypothetical protein SRABI96_01191 [Peribacillus sp. Bi96]|uniref:GyrI-like domain-containing protein n=1 Tax=unclassified Peribacillus TaxID=2675266 RepID=UPI001D2C28BF|nr:GyrI-like domain-containing protein [Peribacillus sp. Bi96]CAH0170887.1 hypothetical protein SRABI96_01191 [Peribacillus sp. Bi96]